jgi:hypothetical protein
VIYSQTFKKVGFLKNSSFKNILNDLETENLRKLVFRHIKLNSKQKLQFRAYPTLLCQLQLDLRVFSQLHVCEKLRSKQL